LTRIEDELMVCAMEAWGILPYACKATDEKGDPVSDRDVAAAVLALVDRGWVEVRRLEPWTAPDGREGAMYGAVIGRAELPAVLADPDTWDDPEGVSWVGEVTLSQVEGWRTAPD
jgi:hypothetical protein